MHPASLNEHICQIVRVVNAKGSIHTEEPGDANVPSSAAPQQVEIADKEQR